MKHLKKGRKFGRVKKQRNALMRGLASSLFKYGKIKTTEAKAKELRPYAEKALTKAKLGSVHSIRILRKKFSKDTVSTMVKKIAPKYKERKGGYTRIMKLPNRKSDGAKEAIIELV